MIWEHAAEWYNIKYSRGHTNRCANCRYKFDHIILKTSHGVTQQLSIWFKRCVFVCACECVCVSMMALAIIWMLHFDTKSNLNLLKFIIFQQFNCAFVGIQLLYSCAFYLHPFHFTAVYDHSLHVLSFSPFSSTALSGPAFSPGSIPMKTLSFQAIHMLIYSDCKFTLASSYTYRW